MTALLPPEPNNQGPAYVIGKIIGGLILAGLVAAVISALAALTIIIWRWAL